MPRPAHLLLIAIALPGVAAAIDPCPDVPSVRGFRCRVAQLNQQKLLGDDAFRKITGKIARVANKGSADCRAGKTRRVGRRLRQLRRPLAKARSTLDRAALRARLPGVHRRELAALIELVDALRRAAATRVRRGTCPQLIEVLRPARGEVTTGDIAVLAALERRTDAGSVTAAIYRADRRGEATDVVLEQRSRGSVWGQTPCPATGSYMLRLRARDGDDVDTIETPVLCADTSPVFGTEVETLAMPDVVPTALRLQPVRPLVGGETYALVVTSGLRTRGGRRAVASEEFRIATGRSGTPPARGAVVHYAEDVGDPANPFPDDRLRRQDGTIALPPGFGARGLPADDQWDGARTFLARLDALAEEHRGFSALTPIFVRLDTPVKLKTAVPPHVQLVRVLRPDAVGSPQNLVTALANERGLLLEDIAIAVTFTVEALPGELRAIRDQVAARAAATPPLPDFDDPNPGDARRFGIYRAGEPGFAEFFAGSPPADAGLVARGSLLSPDYRVEGRIPDTFLDGTVVPGHVPIDFVLVRPHDPVPESGFPAVVLQHGFCGDNAFVIDAAAEFLAAGLAVVGISFPEHGARGQCLDFFDFDDFNSFGNNFRQSTIDLLQLAQLLTAGLDLDADGAPDLATQGIGYLGVSLGGVVGATFAAIDPTITAAVLNVPGGQLAQFAGSASSLAAPFLERFGVEAGLTTRACRGSAAGPSCSANTECSEGESCLLTEQFAQLLEAALPSFQWQLDPGDGISYARLLRVAPESAAPKPVLIQEGIGDVVVANPLTEALARATGVAENRPDRNDAGVAGLWRFAEGAGHGIFGLPEVREQAVTFLATGGTELIEPPVEEPTTDPSTR